MPRDLFGYTVWQKALTVSVTDGFRPTNKIKTELRQTRMLINGSWSG